MATAATAAGATFVVSTNHQSQREPQQRHQQQQLQPQHTLVPSQVFRSKNDILKQNPHEATATAVNHWMMPMPIQTQTPTTVTFASSSDWSSPSRDRPQRVQQQQQRTLPNTQQISQSIASLNVAVPKSQQQRPPLLLYASLQTTTTTTGNTLEPEISTLNDGNLKRGRRRNRTQRKKRAAMAVSAASTNAAIVVMETVTIVPETTTFTSSTSSTTISTTKDNNNNKKFSSSGNLPDIYWRAVSMEHLREHPNFTPLPEPSTIRQLNDLQDVKNFRQESWQWDTLHHGRCTTSQAVAALGFLEPNVGEVLGVPVSWRRGGMGAFVRLSVKPLRTLQEMNEVLIIHDNNDVNVNASATASSNIPSRAAIKKSSVWFQPQATNGESNVSFVAQYQHKITSEQEQERKKYARKISQNENLSKSIRMMWGNTQEATALLTAINYFTKLDPNCTLDEAGMCGADLSLNISSTATESGSQNGKNYNTTTVITSSLLIGATPDGILRHSDGRIEALEVKNHCPFFTNSYHGGKGTKNKGGVRKRFQIGAKPFDDKSNGVFAHYVPQLQLEMLCVGPECHSAVMIRQTATSGAMVLRMHRDNEWIDEMLYWLHRFQLDFVEPKRPPPKNFFWDSSNANDRTRYRRFVNKTNEIRSSRVENVAHIHNDEIQRMGNDTSLFLD